MIFIRIHHATSNLGNLSNENLRDETKRSASRAYQMFCLPYLRDQPITYVLNKIDEAVL